MLIPLRDEHLKFTLRLRNDNRHFFNDSSIICEKAHATWYESWKARVDDFIYVIYYCAEPVGQISIYNFNRADRTAEVGRFVLLERCRSKGIFSSAFDLMIELHKDDKALGNVYLRVKKTNVTAMSAYNAIGFVADVDENREDGLLTMRLVF